MGMNMATIATTAISELIEKNTKVKCLAVSGNFCIDKKPAWLNFISGRGKRVWSEVILKKEIVKEVLKTTPEKFFDVWLSKCMIGSAMSGSLGFNAHFANIVSAFYGATGQDLAHIVEGSMGMTIAKVLENGDLSVSVYLPSVMLGTVGGGTKLKIKQEALSIIGAKNSVELAEVLGGAVLAGEISLLSSLAEGSLSRTHQKLGR
jgi:hydroxymethylglutaryl-CoA reductase (NADPH)